MATTENNFSGNGTAGPFTYTFPVIEAGDVKVFVNGVSVSNYTVDTTLSTVTFTAPFPTAGQAIRIFRETNIDTLAAEFSAGSAIRASDLNDNFIQNLYVTQEISNNAILTDGSNAFDGDLNMGGNQITNLGTPAVDSDAVTKLYVDSRFSSQSIPGYTRWRTTATASQTVFSGVGESGGTLAYSATRENVYVNGALQQRTVDYTADNGTTITFIVGLQAGDIVDVICVNNVSTVTSDQSSEVYFLQSGTGATTRTVESKLKDVVSVKDFGAVGDGVTDDTAAIQAALSSLELVGGVLHFPSGIYKTTSTLTLDLSNYNSEALKNGVCIKGDGDNNTILTGTFSGILLDITGGTVGVELHLHMQIEGIRFRGSSVTDGLHMTLNAFSSINHCSFFGFNYAIQFEDTLSTRLFDCRFRFNKYGIKCNEAVAKSNPNAINLYGCHFGSNTEAGLVLENPALVTLFGGSVEGCGISGTGPTRAGIYVLGGGNAGGVGLACYGVYFENNGGVADIWVSQRNVPVTHTIHSCCFNRAGSTNYPDNNIRLDQDPTDAYVALNIKECSFRGFGTYTPDATRPYIKTFASGTYKINLGDNYFDSELEAPKGIQVGSTYCYFNGNVATPTLGSASEGFATITKAGTGIYDLTFKETRGTTSYPVFAQVFGLIGYAAVYSQTTSSIQVRVYDTAGTLTDAAVSVIS